MAIFGDSEPQHNGIFSIYSARRRDGNSQPTPSTEDLRPKHISSLMLPRKEMNEKPQPSATMLNDDLDNPQNRHLRPLSKDAQIYYSATAVSVIIPIIAMVIWLGVNANRWKEFDWSSVHSNSIGGRLTQPQAKAIDLLCSALIAPSILAAFNFVWFACARVAVINEQQRDKNGVPLACLVEVSSTTGGSYDVLKLSTILAPRTRRLLLLGLLVIASAVAKSALGNVIAYEAYNEDTFGQNSTLRLLSDSQLAIPSSFASPSLVGLWGFNNQQRSSFANQFTGMMTGLSIFNASAELTDDHAYIMRNVTSTSLEEPQTVSALQGVQGSRWTVSCEPFVPDSFMVLQSGTQSVQMTMIRGDTDLISGYYPGSISTIQNAFNEEYPFMLFPADGSSAFIGFTTSFNLSDQRYDSPFGTITPKAFNMTASGFNSTKAIMSVWGISCQISRQEGTLDLARTPDGQWKTVETSVNVSSSKTIYKPLRMQQLQISLNYQAPDVTLPGLGAALARSADPCYDATTAATDAFCINATTSNTTTTDFSTLALNFLYASAETERIAYEVAATNTSRDEPDFFYTVLNTNQTLHYRITYVPVILFVGIGCIFVAALITVWLVASAWKSTSGRLFRQVDGLRLIVDCLAGLRGGEQEQDHDRHVFEEAKGESNGGLLSWAKGYRVRYEKEGLTEGVGLVHVN